MNQVVDEAQLLHDTWCDHKRVEIAFTHRAAYAINRENEWKPRFDDLTNAVREVRIEVHGSSMVAYSVDRGPLTLSIHNFAVSAASRAILVMP